MIQCLIEGVLSEKEREALLVVVKTVIGSGSLQMAYVFQLGEELTI